MFFQSSTNHVNLPAVQTLKPFDTVPVVSHTINMEKLKSLLLGFITCCNICTGYAQEVKKQSYNLFKPVPADNMRDMATDRPDVTESPFSVDAGHFQYESDLFRYKNERDQQRSKQTWLVNQANLKLGIFATTDVQLVIQSYGKQRERDLPGGTQKSADGIGDLTLRIKQNLIGSDHGNFALAVLPYVKFPTSKFDAEGRYEYGLILPMQFELPGEWKLGFQVETDRLKDDDVQSMHTELLQSVTLSHEIIKGFDGIAETFYTYDFKQHHWANFVNAALQIAVLKDFKLDAGLNYGIQSDAEKNYFIGTSFRF